MSDGILECELRDKWCEAEYVAKTKGDFTKLIEILRRLQGFPEIANLHFMADLLEGKYDKGVGQPPKEKFAAEIRKRNAAANVMYLISEKIYTRENAILEAARILGMSNSAVEKAYDAARKRIALTVDVEDFEDFED